MLNRHPGGIAARSAIDGGAALEEASSNSSGYPDMTSCIFASIKA
jgi:hypothetical protein